MEGQEEDDEEWDWNVRRGKKRNFIHSDSIILNLELQYIYLLQVLDTDFGWPGFYNSQI